MKRIVLMLSCFFLIACTDVQEERSEPEITKEMYEHTTQANNTLGYDLLDELKQENENILLSPTSAFIAILMAYNGAEEETKQEIEKALSLDSLTSEQWNEAIREVGRIVLQDEDTVEMLLANSVWLNDKYEFQTSFTEAMEQYFQAEVAEIEIGNPDSAKRINDWVSEQTKEKITEIVEGPLHPDTVAFLINAVYFNGSWTYPFNEVLTTEESFYTSAGEINAPFMTLDGEELAYVATDAYQAVRLPYGVGKMSMYVFLPQEVRSVQDVQEHLAQAEWNEIRQQFVETEGTVHLPKFTLEYETKLNEALKALGMTRAFDVELAQFPHMIENHTDPIWIEEVKQKTYIDVNEAGTEAAGVTSVEMRTTSAIIGDTFYMDVNRPFLFTITEEELGLHLFIGIIENPSKAE